MDQAGEGVQEMDPTTDTTTWHHWQRSPHWQQLHRVLLDLRTEDNLDQPLHTLAGLVETVLDGPMVSIHLVDGAEVAVVAVVGRDRVGDELEGRRVELGTWERLLSDPAPPDGPMLTPLRAPEGDLLAVIVAERPPDSPGVTPEQQALIQACADLVGLALYARHCGQALRHDRERSQTREEALRLTMENAPIGMALISLADADRGAIVKVNRALGDLFGYRDTDFTSLRVTDLLDCADVTPLLTELAGTSTEPPVQRHDCRCFRSDGTTWWGRIHATVLPHTTDEPPVLLAQVVDLTGRQENGREPARRAVRDPLTGLLNRTMVLERLDRVVGSVQNADRPGVALHCDLMQFHQLHETNGHVIADELLVTVARRIAGVLRKSDTVGRLGDADFLVVVPEISPEGAHRLAERLHQAVSAPISVRGRTYHVQVRIDVIPLVEGISPLQVLGEANGPTEEESTTWSLADRFRGT